MDREQLEQGWPLPGLAREVENICAPINIKNINENDVPKWIIKDAVRVHHATEAREEMDKKLENIKNEEIGRTRDYMETKCISDCRLQFRIRTNMVELKANMKGSYKGGAYSCLGCGDKASVEDQSHVIRCPAYSDIRQGLDMEEDKDVVQYFRRVMIVRMKKKR